MRSNGLATVLLMIPVLAVPALAIFGIPQFSSVTDSNFNDLFEDPRDSRAGQSIRKSNSDLFGDIDPPGTESDDPSMTRQDSEAVENSRSNIRSRRKNESAVQNLEAELAADQELSLLPQRKQSSTRPNEPFLEDFTETKEPNPLPVAGRSTQPSTRSRQSVDPDEPTSLASTGGLDQAVLQAGFEEEIEPEKPKPVSKKKRSGLSGSEQRAPKRRESGIEPLTMKTAVERLSELDIRTFRLEKHEDGQFVFICSYTPADTPRCSYRFEAEADEPLKAVEKVLEQIVEWRRQRK